MHVESVPFHSNPGSTIAAGQRRQAGASSGFPVRFSVLAALAVQHFNSLQYHFETFSYVNLCTLRLPIGNVRGRGRRWDWRRAKDEICVGLQESTNWSGANMIFIFWELNYFLFAVLQSATVDFQLESIRDQLRSTDRNSERASRRRRRGMRRLLWARDFSSS